MVWAVLVANGLRPQRTDQHAHQTGQNASQLGRKFFASRGQEQKQPSQEAQNDGKNGTLGGGFLPIQPKSKGMKAPTKVT
jgi:hypothetical protein